MLARNMMLASGYRSGGGGYDEYTKLMLHFDGADGATTTIDSSASAHAMALSYTGTGPTIATDQSKFGGSSFKTANQTSAVYAGPSSDWDFGTGDFTIDCWMRLAVKTTYAQVCAIDESGGFKYSFGFSPSVGTIFVYSSTTQILAGPSSGAVAFNAGVWYHLALVRSGTSWKLYRDGTLYASSTSALPFGNSANNLMIGYVGYSAGGTGGTNGWIDEFRVSKGIARWTANFAPPMAPYS